MKIRKQKILMMRSCFQIMKISFKIMKRKLRVMLTPKNFTNLKSFGQICILNTDKFVIRLKFENKFLNNRLNKRVLSGYFSI